MATTRVKTTALAEGAVTTSKLASNVVAATANNADYLGGVAANQYAYANATSNSITSNNYSTVQESDGRLVAPGEVYGQFFTLRGGNANGSIGSLGYSGDIITLAGNGVRISGGLDEGSLFWEFANTGSIIFPDTTSQTTAYTGNIGGYEIGYLDVPQNYTNTSFTIALSDRGKHIYTANGTSQTITIANNETVAFPIGTAISIVSQGAGTVTVARGTGVQLYLAANNTSTDRTISSYGMATILKVATDTWFINGAGVS